jgi:hypothetical protein
MQDDPFDLCLDSLFRQKFVACGFFFYLMSAWGKNAPSILVVHSPRFA